MEGTDPSLLFYGWGVSGGWPGRKVVAEVKLLEEMKEVKIVCGGGGGGG